MITAAASPTATVERHTAHRARHTREPHDKPQRQRGEHRDEDPADHGISRLDVHAEQDVLGVMIALGLVSKLGRVCEDVDEVYERAADGNHIQDKKSRGARDGCRVAALGAKGDAYEAEQVEDAEGVEERDVTEGSLDNGCKEEREPGYAEGGLDGA